LPKHLVVTADDFGLDTAVNDAVEAAHLEGILTSASLMVGAPAAADAVERARRLPGLRVGLHLTLVNATPLVPAAEVPALVGPTGAFRSDLFRAGVAYFFGAETREQLRREIQAQFDAFVSTGLTLDHANAHRHMHVHPTVAALMIEIGAPAGLAAVRVPIEPAATLRRADPGRRLARPVSRMLMRPWAGLLRRRLLAAGLLVNDRVFGIAWSGHMEEPRVLRLLGQLPAGVNEIYFHPTTAGAAPTGHASRDELATLTSPRIRREIERHEIELTSFGELAARAAPA
jgi:hopanoid biosynthesis associated protein HpnK